jgi:hypothetical protein
VIVIDPECGSLHESRGKRWIGPPKTAASARTIILPPFLVTMLRDHLASHPYEYVFTTPSGAWLWRSTFNRRILRPATDGNHNNWKASHWTDPVKPGLTFHGLRHSHKTWLIDDGVPEIGQSRRLGHHLQDRVIETYSHVAAGVEKRLLTGLEHRWRVAWSAVRPPRSHTIDDRRHGSGKKARRANKTRRRSAAGSSRRLHGRPTSAQGGPGRLPDAPGARVVDRDVFTARHQGGQDVRQDDRPLRSGVERNDRAGYRLLRDSTDVAPYHPDMRRPRNKMTPTGGDESPPSDVSPPIE